MKKLLILSTLIFTIGFSQTAGAVTCIVDEPISAAALNSGGMWSYEVFNGTPNAHYKVKVNWVGDPSNAGHTNSGVDTNSQGYAITTHPGYWASDGFLPGVFTPDWVGIPGDFSVQVLAPHRGEGWPNPGKGKANCKGTVTE